MRKFKFKFCATAAGLLVGVGLLSVPLTESASAANGSDFNAGHIISDDQFFDGNSMTVAEIQSFLNSKGANCVAGEMPCLKDYQVATPARSAEAGLCGALGATNGLTAAQILYYVGQACGISPKVMIVTLQKEASLVTRTKPTVSNYRAATGFGCPDTAPCDAQYYGYFNQVYQMARQFKVYTSNPTRYGYQAGRNNTILYNPDRGCGSSSVYIQNQATANLYIYTPYQPNAAALQNINGTGDSCSAYGNRNFWRFFTDWFGNPTNQGRPVVTNTGGIPVMATPDGPDRILGWLGANWTVSAQDEEINGYLKISYGSLSGWVKRYWLAENPTPTRTLYTTTNGIAVYLGPGVGYYKAGDLGPNLKISVAEEKNGFVRIVYGSTGGWIDKAWTSEALGTNPVAKRTVYTNTAGVPLLQTAQAGSPVLGTYPAGKAVEADAGEVNGYVHVVLGLTGAWIRSDWLSSNPTATGTATTNTGGIPVFLGPGAGYYVAGALGSSQAVAIAGTKGGFTNVVFGKTGGWVESKWLSTNPSPTGVGYSNTGGVPVYLGPGSGYVGAGWLSGGTKLAVAGQKDGYINIVYGNTGGWVKSEWISKNPTPTGVAYTTTSGIPVYLGPGAGYVRAPGEISVGVGLSTGSESNGYVNIVYGDSGGWVLKKWLTTDGQGSNPPAQRVMITNTSGVPVRSTASDSGAIVATYGAKSVVKAQHGVQNGYVHIVFGSTGAWIKADWLSGNPTATRKGTTNTGGVPVYFGPGDGYALGAQLGAKAPLQLSDNRSNGYVQVVLGDYGGWVSERWLTFNPTTVSSAMVVTGGVPILLSPDLAYAPVGYAASMTEVDVSTDQVNGYRRVVFGDSGGWIPSKWLAQNPEASIDARTNTGGVPVYIGPGAGYTAIASLGGNVAVSSSTEIVNGYVHVVSGKHGGWIDRKWLVWNPNPVRNFVTTTSGVPLYLGPGTGYVKVGELSVSSAVKASSEESNGYVWIVFGSTGAWVEKRWLAPA